MCCLRHPQYRWDDRQIQHRPNHSAGGNSEGETEDTSPSSNTPRGEITPTYGATRSNANPNTCGTTSTDSNEKTKGPGHTGIYAPHSRNHQPAETALSQGEHQGPHSTTIQRTTDLLRKSQELMKRQTRDLHLFSKIQDLDNRGTGGEYVTNDDGLLWYAPRFHPTSSQSPFPGTRHPGTCSHHLWPSRSSPDY